MTIHTKIIPTQEDLSLKSENGARILIEFQVKYYLTTMDYTINNV